MLRVFLRQTFKTGSAVLMKNFLKMGDTLINKIVVWGQYYENHKQQLYLYNQSDFKLSWEVWLI